MRSLIVLFTFIQCTFQSFVALNGFLLAAPVHGRRRVVLGDIYSSSSSTRPPINAMYELNIKIPVIGQQRFQLQIQSDSMAQLVIDGLLQVNDVVSYKIDSDGALSFTLSQSTKDVMKKFRTQIVSAKYCGESDTPSIVVSPPLPKKIKLNLNRTE